MKNLRVRTAQNKGGRRSPKSNDFISKMPDDVLVKIISLLSTKDAVATSSLSPRWRFLWCNLIELDLDSTEILDNMTKDQKVSVSDRLKYINKVNSVIKGHSHPHIQFFQIGFDLDVSYSDDIDNWIGFALDKRVETLKLNFDEKRHETRDPTENYDLPLLLPTNATFVQMSSLKEVFLSRVNVTELALMIFLKNSPNLKSLDVYRAVLGTDVHVGGPDINLKRFRLVGCSGIESLYLYDLNLVSFTYQGQNIEFHFNNLLKLKVVDIGHVSLGLENNVFPQISSCVPYIQDLSLDLDQITEDLDVDSIPEFPKVKKLMLTFGAEEDNCLLEYTSIAKACPCLETFAISLIWDSPMKRRRKVRRVGGHPHKKLKLLEMFGFYGRISDLELAVYVIDNAAALEKIVIDPFCHASYGDYSKQDLVRKQQAARAFAKRQLTLRMPRGVELAIL